jgi:hypothetical protein
MSKRWAIPLGGLLVLGGLCGGCLWSALERPRFTQTFDIGGGRTLTVWSIRRDFLLDFDPDPNPLMVYYRVNAGTQELVPKTFLDHDDGGEYQFRVVQADGGRLACVYDTARAIDHHYFLLMFDADSGESWPRVRDDETNQQPPVVDKWRGRFGRLKAEHPGLPTPDPFDGLSGCR